MRAINILFVVMLALICTRECKMEDSIEIVRRIVQEIINNSYCIVFSSFTDKIASVVQKAFVRTRTNNVHTFYVTDKEIENLRCNGYIIFSEKLSDLQSAFGARILASDQLLNMKILVLYHGTVSDRSKLANLFPKGTRAIFVEGLKDDSIEIWNKTATRSLPLKITFTLTGKEVTLNSIKDFDFKEFRERSWRPQIDRKFRISLFDSKPYVVYHKESKTFSGMEYRMVEEATKNLPVEYRIHGLNNSKEARGFWDEIVNDVIRGDSDLAFSSLFQAYTVMKNVSLTIAHSQACITFLVPKPELLSEASYVFQPLHLNLWLLILTVTVITSLCVRFLTHLGQKFDRNTENITFSENISPIMFGIRIFTLGSVKKRIPSSQIYLRVMFLAFAFTCLCFSTAYSGGFTSSLTYPRYSKPIWTVKDMVEQNVRLAYPQTPIDKALLISVLKDSVNPYARFLIHKIASDDSNKYSDAILIKISGQKYITNTADLDNYFKTHYQVLRECLKQESLVFVLQKNSPFTSFFNSEIQRFVEHGFVDYWYRIALSDSDMSYMSNFYTVYVQDFRPKPLNCKKLQGAFYLLAVGLLAGLISFLLELKY